MTSDQHHEQSYLYRVSRILPIQPATTSSRSGFRSPCANGQGGFSFDKLLVGSKRVRWFDFDTYRAVTRSCKTTLIACYSYTAVSRQDALTSLLPDIIQVCNSRLAPASHACDGLVTCCTCPDQHLIQVVFGRAGSRLWHLLSRSSADLHKSQFCCKQSCIITATSRAA